MEEGEDYLKQLGEHKTLQRQKEKPTKKICFAQFLHHRHVPFTTSPAYDCGRNSQIAKHVIRHCRLRPRRQRMLEDAGTTDYRTLMTTLKSFKAVTA